ncbi:MAG TPA: glycosyltransferase [Solirubrobacteraceae bacterium]|jgi:glycosyltransferase involved in cell wall biosynthesis|nr:glycosyltransferase [Solirubrobacteraceae bacterium]
MSEEPSRPSGAGTKIAVVGVSLGSPCGVHAHATALADELRHNDVACSLHWLWRNEAPLVASGSELRAWTKRLGPELQAAKPDALLLHYSVFAYSFRGFPVFVHPLLSVIRDLGVPTVTLLHEYAYPWHRGGVRGAGWALSQRALLYEVMRTSAAVLATTDFRADWLSTRSWLPDRPIALAPVFSGLPRASAAAPDAAEREARVLGLFGWGHEGVAIEIVLDALRALQDRGIEAELVLLGAPGRGSAAGESWLAAADGRGIVRPLELSGMLAAQDLADRLTSCDVLLSADRIGPTSRRTTLAASLAAGRPVVALDGRHTWRELRQAQAALIVEPRADALADGLAELLRDAEARAQLAHRGSEFATRAMSVERSARTVGQALDEVIGGSPPS